MHHTSSSVTKDLRIYDIQEASLPPTQEDGQTDKEAVSDTTVPLTNEIKY